MYGGDLYQSGLEAHELAKKITYNMPFATRYLGQKLLVRAKYFESLYTKLPEALNTYKPDLIVYVGGISAYTGDTLGSPDGKGNMDLSSNDIVDRDQFVFAQAHTNKIPIAMMLGGGSSAHSANVMNKSIENVLRKVYGVKTRE